MRAFNSFQLVSAFSAFPFLIQWLDAATFRWHTAAFWVALVAYVVAFGFMCMAVYDATED